MIQLGCIVKDMITGLEGVAIARTEWLYGCARIALEPRELKDGKPLESQWFDEQRVEQVSNAPTIPVQDRTGTVPKLGSHVKDTVSGFEGIAVAVAEWYTGEITISIEPQKMHEGKPILAYAFNLRQVALVEEKAPPVSKQSSARSGGPQNDPVRH